MLPGCLKHLLTSRGVKKFARIHSFANISEANAKESLGKRTRVQGWVRALRKMKDNIFLDINDGSTNQHLQIVMKKELKPDNLCYGSSVSIVGEIASAPNGRAEVRAEEVKVLGTCDLDNYPFLPRKQYTQEYIRQYLHLRPRTRQFASVLRLRDLATSAVGEHMRRRGFVNVHTPILTSNDCEGAGEVFNVVPESVDVIESMKKDKQSREETYFDAKAFLTVSGQLHLEIVARAFSKVYTFGPTFRAENSKSRLHLSEFYMIEAEMAFVDNVEDVAAEAELLVKGVTSALFERGAADTQNIGAAQPTWLDKSFGVFSYDEAFDILERHSDKITVNVKRGEAFSKEQELFLVEFNGGIPVFILNWPKNIKPFYMKECKDDNTKVAAMDLLAPQVGELFGGSLREDNYEKLKEKIPPTADVSWYVDLRKHGNVPTGGYGMGFERYLQTVLGVLESPEEIVKTNQVWENEEKIISRSWNSEAVDYSPKPSVPHVVPSPAEKRIQSLLADISRVRDKVIETEQQLKQAQDNLDRQGEALFSKDTWLHMCGIDMHDAEEGCDHERGLGIEDFWMKRDGETTPTNSIEN